MLHTGLLSAGKKHTVHWDKFLLQGAEKRSDFLSFFFLFLCCDTFPETGKDPFSPKGWFHFYFTSKIGIFFH